MCVTFLPLSGAAEPNNFASMIAQAAIVRKGSLVPTRKVSNHNHFPSDPVDRMASIKTAKRESYSNSSTDTSFSTTSNSGFSTGEYIYTMDIAVTVEL